MQGLRKTAVSGQKLCTLAVFLRITCTAKTNTYCMKIRSGAVARPDTQTEIIADLAAAAHKAIVQVRIIIGCPLPYIACHVMQTVRTQPFLCLVPVVFLAVITPIKHI